MEHGEEEEEWGNGKRRSMRMSDATMIGEASKQQALRLAEDLSLPSVQVVVMSANMGCPHCRQRVTKVVSKMNGLLDYMVDFGKKEVTVRAVVHPNKRKHVGAHGKRKGFRSTTWPSWLLGCYGF